MRRLSLNARLAADAPASADIEVVLMEISHPDLEAPIRLSTDPSERLQSDPLMWGTRSPWRGANPLTQPFLWIVASVVIPGDADDAPAQALIVLENIDSAMAELLRSFTAPPSVAMAVVLASSPDLVEAEWIGLQITSAEITAGEITLTLSRDEIEMEPFPAGRMTRMRFPGLHS